MPDPALEALRLAVPAARSLPLHASARRRRAGSVVLDYLDVSRAAVQVAAMRMNRAWIEAHIPHHGRMCLLDEVLAWDAHHIRCRSRHPPRSG